MGKDRGTLQSYRAAPRPHDQVRVPPMPAYFSMIDREDGTEWFLTWLAQDGYFSISDTPPPDRFQTQVLRFGPQDGPWLGNGIRLLVRDGRLGYDMPRVADKTISPLTFARSKWKRYSLQVQRGPWQREGDTLGYKEVRP